MEYFRQQFLDELNDEGDIEIRGLRWSRQQVLEALDRSAFEDIFTDWVDDAKQSAKERAREFLAETGCLDRFLTLSAKVESGNVLPFVGAGMSIASGCKPWSAFLISLLSDAPHILKDVEQCLSNGRYEEAAEQVQEALGESAFAEEIHNQLGKQRHRTVAGPIALLPILFQTGVMTTNFDYVLTHAYTNFGNPFSHEFAGASLREARRRINDNPHCLLRLHGEADTKDGRVLTRTEYDATYNGAATLKATLAMLIGHRSLLFMGCSLHADRTVAALKEIRSNSPDLPVRHYAFLPCPSIAERPARRAFLSEAEIHPIYYPADNHDKCIEDLLITLIEGGLDG